MVARTAINCCLPKSASVAEVRDGALLPGSTPWSSAEADGPAPRSDPPSSVAIDLSTGLFGRPGGIRQLKVMSQSGEAADPH